MVEAPKGYPISVYTAFLLVPFMLFLSNTDPRQQVENYETEDCFELSDCCVHQFKQFFSYIMMRTYYIP